MSRARKDPEGAQIDREYGPFAGVTSVAGVTYDGRRVWIAAGDHLHAFDPSTGETQGSLPVACDAGTAFDGRHLFQIVGAEIRKVRPAVVISVDTVGRLPLRMVVPITDWKPRYSHYPWLVELPATATNGLTKDSGADAFQTKSVSLSRFVQQLGEITPAQLDEIAEAIALCVGVP